MLFVCVRRIWYFGCGFVFAKDALDVSIRIFVFSLFEFTHRCHRISGRKCDNRLENLCRTVDSCMLCDCWMLNAEKWVQQHSQLVRRCSSELKWFLRWWKIKFPINISLDAITEYSIKYYLLLTRKFIIFKFRLWKRLILCWPEYVYVLCDSKTKLSKNRFSIIFFFDHSIEERFPN